MSDDPVRTIIRTDGGELPFQDYFVRLACAVPVRSIRYDGASAARLNPALGAARRSLSAIIICPSNPYLSVDPILAVPGMRAWLRAQGCPIVAVSPIVGGAAIKGPAAKIMAELGAPASAVGIARHYAGLVDGLVIDTVDAGLGGADCSRRHGREGSTDGDVELRMTASRSRAPLSPLPARSPERS